MVRISNWVGKQLTEATIIAIISIAVIALFVIVLLFEIGFNRFIINQQRKSKKHI